MFQEEIIYDDAKNNLKKYGRNFHKSTNEKIVYECAAIIFSIRQEYKEDTRFYNVPKSIYEIYKDMIYKLQSQISKEELNYEDAAEACIKALTFTELVVRSRVGREAFAS